MKKTRIGLLVAAALCMWPAAAWGQKKPAGQAAQPGGGEAGAADEGAAGEDDELVGDELPDETPGGEGLDDICKIDPAACPKLDFDKEAAKPLREQIYAVQQIYALRVRRFEVQPYWSFTLNDQFVSHPGPGIALNYYITNVLAVGANFNYYRPFNVDSEFNAQVRRAARVGVPLTEYDWGAALNFTYVPAYGKFAGFGDFIFHYDAYVVGGVGAISTRPIPVMDPDNRNFEFQPKLAFNAGIGLRIFFTRWFAAILEVRDYIYNEELENTEVATTIPQQQNESTWYGDSKLTNNVAAQVGISIFLPFSFEYRLPK
jgi:outer membrane beta-barrel protein